jgi:phosphatidate cytidylyltransferase
MIALLALTGAAIWTRGPSGHPAAAIAVTLFGAVYAGGTLSFAYLLRYHDYTVTAAAGTAILFFPLVVTWICDSAAYAVGRKWGRHKLIPRVSPGKTVEGAIAGTVAGGICALLYVLLVLRPTSQMTIAPAWAVLLGIVIAVVAQVGDLAESLFKRAAGVKDSSSLLPGHGGILDRLDSLYFVLPLSFLLIGSLLIPAPR